MVASLSGSPLFGENASVFSGLNSTDNATSLSEIRLYLWHEVNNDPVIIVLLRYVFPPFIFLGMFGNTFCFLSIITRRLYLKSPVFIFYMFLALSDLVEVTCESLYVFEEYLKTGIHSDNDMACKVVLWLDHSSMFSSSWLLVSVTAFRLYGIARPLDMIKRNSLKISTILCTVIVSVICTISIHVFWTNGQVINTISPTEQLSLCYVPDREIAKYYALIMVIFYSLGPGFILIILSLGIIVSFILSYRRHRKLVRGQFTESSQEISSTYTTAKNSVAMLIPLAMLQIACTFPLFIYIIIFGFNRTYPAVFFAFNRMRCINHSLNLYIQSLVSKFYREKMLPCCTRESQK